MTARSRPALRVLIADKDPNGLDAMRSELLSPGIEVISARDGREVVEHAGRYGPDVVIVAASLGQMGGFAVSRELKMLADRPRAAPSPKVAVLLEREADAWLAAWSRCDAWRVKPIDPVELQALVRELASG